MLSALRPGPARRDLTDIEVALLNFNDRLETQAILTFGCLIKQTDEIDTAHILTAGVVVVGGYQPVFVTMRLMSQPVIG